MLRKRQMLFHLFFAVIAKKLGLVVAFVDPADVSAALVADQFGGMCEVIRDCHA